MSIGAFLLPVNWEIIYNHSFNPTPCYIFFIICCYGYLSKLSKNGHNNFLSSGEVFMLSKISLFFKNLTDEMSVQESPLLSLELACAVLLCEVMRADGTLTVTEEIMLNKTLSQQFSLTPSEIDEIFAKAQQLSENATDFYQFTSTLNQHYSLEQRIKIVGLLWQVAYADGELASIEEHIIRKIADLLHLNHSEYIQSKINASPLQ